MKSLATHVLLFIIAILLIISSASATIDITPSSGSSYIDWSWPAATVTNISIDGMYVCNFDPGATHFILSDLGPGETHSISIYTAGDSGTNTTQTTESSTSLLAFFLSSWSYLILILALVIIGMIKKLGFVEVFASLISLYALAEYVRDNPVLSVTDIWHVQLMIYCFFVVFPYLLIYFKGGFTK